MNDLRLSPPLSFAAAADQDLFRAFRGQMHADAADQVMLDTRDAAGGPVTAPIRTPSTTSTAGAKDANDAPPLQTYLSYCSEFLDLAQYPKLAEQDRAVIADFISGELLQNIQWKYLFPHGAFECILSTRPGPETDDYACTEYTVFKINFETISCSKDIRRVWTSKAKPKVDEPAVSETVDDADRSKSLELQSPIKQQSTKRRTPTRRRSFEERDRKLSTSRTRSASNEPPPAKKTAKTTPKAGKKADKTTTPKTATAGRKAKASSTTTPKKTTPKKTTPRKTSVSKKKAAAEPVMVTSNETYAVLAILDCKKKSGKFLYRVRWAGTDPQGKPWQDTWEPVANISDDLLLDYWQRQQPKSKTAAADDDKVSVEHLLNSDPPAA